MGVPRGGVGGPWAAPTAALPPSLRRHHRLQTSRRGDPHPAPERVVEGERGGDGNETSALGTGAAGSPPPAFPAPRVPAPQIRPGEEEGGHARCPVSYGHGGSGAPRPAAPPVPAPLRDGAGSWWEQPVLGCPKQLFWGSLSQYCSSPASCQPAPSSSVNPLGGDGPPALPIEPPPTPRAQGPRWPQRHAQPEGDLLCVSQTSVIPSPPQPQDLIQPQNHPGAASGERSRGLWCPGRGVPLLFGVRVTDTRVGNGPGWVVGSDGACTAAPA